MVGSPFFPDIPATASTKLDVTLHTPPRIDIRSLAPTAKVLDYDTDVLAPLHQAQAAKAAAEAAQAAHDAKVAAEAAAAAQAAQIAAEQAEEAHAAAVRSAPNVGNDYTAGQCTWYVASRTAVPMTMGNATSWENGLLAAGWHYGVKPGAIGVSHFGWAGHVVYVESVVLGVVTISEMNALAGPFNVDTRVATPGEFTYLSL